MEVEVGVEGPADGTWRETESCLQQPLRLAWTDCVMSKSAMNPWSGYHLQLPFRLFFSCSLHADSHLSAAVLSPWFSVLVKQEAAKLAANVGQNGD